MSSVIWNRFESNVARHPDKAALIYLEKGIWKTVTYAQLLNSTNRIAFGLQACSLTSGMRAVLMTPPSAEFFVLVFALLKLGIVPIMVDPAIGLRKITECLKEASPDIFIGNTLTHTLRIIFGWGKESIKHNLTIDKVKSAALTVRLSLTVSKGQKSKVEEPIPNPHSLTSNSPAAIIYTSGSTGIPKGVLYTHSNFSAQLDMLQETFNIEQDEIDLPAFPLYVLIDVLLGVTSVIPDITFPVPGKTNPKKVLNAIQKFKVTNMFASPVVLDILVKYWSSSVQQQAVGLQNLKLQSLKRVITAGAPATIQLQEKFRKLLNNETNLFGVYGATEALPIAKVESREVFANKNKTTTGAGICLGTPVKGTQVRIIRISDSAIERWQDDLKVQSNVVGEITVQGAAGTESYIGRLEANQLAKINDGDDIIHRMGDVGYFDDQGCLWYCGRKSHRLITKNDVLFTEQIEGIFNAHPLVYRTALVGVKSKPILWVELEKDFQTNQDKIKSELIELSKEHPQASQIKVFLFMKKFPTDVRHNSKIIREELTVLAEKRFA